MSISKKPLTPIQKLDTVLYILQQQNSYKIFSEIENIITDANIIIPQDNLVRIIDKLINDGYIIEAKTDKRNNLIEKRYIISYSGHLFAGYGNQEEMDRFNKVIASQKEIRAIRNERLLVRGTWAAAIVAAFLLLWNIWIWLYPVHKDFPYWIWETVPKKVK